MSDPVTMDLVKMDAAIPAPDMLIVGPKGGCPHGHREGPNGTGGYVGTGNPPHERREGGRKGLRSLHLRRLVDEALRRPVPS